MPPGRAARQAPSSRSRRRTGPSRSSAAPARARDSRSRARRSVGRRRSQCRLRRRRWRKSSRGEFRCDPPAGAAEPGDARSITGFAPSTDLQGPGRPGRGPRLVHRVVPAVRTRPRGLQLVVRREARPAAQNPRAGRGHMVRAASPGAERPGRLPAAPAGSAPDLGRGRWDAGVVRPRRHARAAAHGRNHRFGSARAGISPWQPRRISPSTNGKLCRANVHENLLPDRWAAAAVVRTPSSVRARCDWKPCRAG